MRLHSGWRGVVCMSIALGFWWLGEHYAATLFVIVGSVLIHGYAHDRLN